MTTLLSELREPPIVGQHYLVPVLRAYPWHRWVDDWPVFGPLHDDDEFFKFPHRHYHIDVRFVTAVQRKRMASAAFGHEMRSVSYAPEFSAFAYPLNSRQKAVPAHRPPLVRLRCSQSDWKFGGFDNQGRIQAMRDALGDPAPAIVLADGRKLCPHRKADLSSLTPDEDGIVTCPLHGLRVQCGPTEIEQICAGLDRTA